MTLPQIIARNQIQSLAQNVQADGNPSTIGSTTTITMYTCPAGKVALVTSLLVRFTGLGGNTSVFVNARALRLREATATEASMIESAGQGIRLEATETITLTGDNGADNGSAFFVVSVVELPA